MTLVKRMTEEGEKDKYVDGSYSQTEKSSLNKDRHLQDQPI